MSSWWRTRNPRNPRLRTALSAAATCRSFSTVMGSPYAKRDDRQATAGLSQVRSPKALGEQADLGFGQTNLLQRAAHPELTGGTHPGSKIVEIIDIRAVDDMSQTARPPSSLRRE